MFVLSACCISSPRSLCSVNDPDWFTPEALSLDLNFVNPISSLNPDHPKNYVHALSQFMRLPQGANLAHECFTVLPRGDEAVRMSLRPIIDAIDVATESFTAVPRHDDGITPLFALPHTKRDGADPILGRTYHRIPIVHLDGDSVLSKDIEASLLDPTNSKSASASLLYEDIYEPQIMPFHASTPQVDPVANGTAAFFFNSLGVALIKVSLTECARLLPLLQEAPSIWVDPSTPPVHSPTSPQPFSPPFSPYRSPRRASRSTASPSRSTSLARGRAICTALSALARPSPWASARA